VAAISVAIAAMAGLFIRSNPGKHAKAPDGEIRRDWRAEAGAQSTRSSPGELRCD
jgi:hypothetical protein